MRLGDEQSGLTTAVSGHDVNPASLTLGTERNTTPVG